MTNKSSADPFDTLRVIAAGRRDCGRPLSGAFSMGMARETLTACGLDWAPKRDVALSTTPPMMGDPISIRQIAAAAVIGFQCAVPTGHRIVGVNGEEISPDDLRLEFEDWARCLQAAIEGWGSRLRAQIALPTDAEDADLDEYLQDMEFLENRCSKS